MALPTTLVHGDPSTRCTLLASAARTASSTSGIFSGTDRYGTVLIFLDCTARSGTSPTLDVYIQTLLPDSTTWTDIAAFTQLTATGQRYISFTSGGSGVESAVQAGALTAATFKNITFGEAFRVKYTIGGTNPSFTFSMTALFGV